MDDRSTQSFYLSLPWMVVQVAALVTPPILLLNWILLGHPFVLHHDALRTGAIAGLLSMLVVYWISTVRVGPTGISAHTLTLKRRALSWSEIRSARPRWLFPLRSLEIEPVDGSPVYVSRYLQDPGGFVDAVRAHAPQGHVVRDALSRVYPK